MSVYKIGPNTLAVPMAMFRENRMKLVQNLEHHAKVDDKTLILMQGGEAINLYNTDVEYIFRQEPFFFYLFGVTEAGCYGTIDATSGKTTLFIPRLPADYAVWMGVLKSCDDFKRKYEVDEVFYVDEIDKVVCEKSPSILLTLTGKNSDSGLIINPATFDGIEKYVSDCDILHPILSECRVTKSPAELEVMRYVSKISSDAHKEVMRMIKPGVTEYQAESLFLHHTYSVGGSRHTSYTCICGSGDNSAILHYGHAGAPNDRVIKDGDMCLFDMGANYCGYAADITCSFPANGKFTEDQKFIYNAVLAARNAVIANAKEGVSWVDMHLLANRTLLQKLCEGGLLHGNVNDMIAAGMNGIFQPHGLGHLLGLDVHDVGGYLKNCPPRPTQSGVTSLRFARNLLAGMVLTVEPGCYFIDSLLDKALANPNQAKFINADMLKRFRNFGGVRIEDDCYITKDGCVNMTIVPRTVEEIEEFMAR